MDSVYICIELKAWRELNSHDHDILNAGEYTTVRNVLEEECAAKKEQPQHEMTSTIDSCDQK